MTDQRTILVVDDDDSQLALASTVLEDDGFVVRAFSDAASALEHCAREAPSLVLSDVVMPGFGGFELQTRYAKRFPERSTPFVFLSSIDDPAAIVRGLDAGADDFLRKPIEPAVLKAKVRAILRRRRGSGRTSFRGDLSRLSLPGLLRFCEVQGLTGFLDVFVGDTLLSLRFRAGQIDDPDADATLTRIAELESAPFVVHSAPVDFDELCDGHAPRRTQPPPSIETPIGRVSSVRLNRKLFQIETRVVGDDPLLVVSVVTVEGRAVWKHSEKLRGDAGAEELTRLVDVQHDRLESRLNDRLAEHLLETRVEAPSKRELFHKLFDEGFDSFRAGEFAVAIDRWERALAIDPSSAALRVNVRVAREKLAARR